MNTITISGRLARNVELIYANGTDPLAVAKFVVAVGRAFKNKEGKYDADFFNCICYRKQAEAIDKHFSKGDAIEITGEMQNNKYTDKEGKTRDWWQVKVDKFGFGMGKKEAGNSTEAPPANNEGFYPADESIEDESLPF